MVGDSVGESVGGGAWQGIISDALFLLLVLSLTPSFRHTHTHTYTHTHLPMSRYWKSIPMVEGTDKFIKGEQICFKCPQRMCRDSAGDMGRWYLKGTVNKYVKKTKWPENKLKDEVERECRRTHCNPLCLKYV